MVSVGIRIYLLLWSSSDHKSKRQKLSYPRRKTAVSWDFSTKLKSNLNCISWPPIYLVILYVLTHHIFRGKWKRRKNTLLGFIPFQMDNSNVSKYFQDKKYIYTDCGVYYEAYYWLNIFWRQKRHQKKFCLESSASRDMKSVKINFVVAPSVGNKKW